MSMSICVVARRLLTSEDRALVDAHNRMCDGGYETPAKLLDDLGKMLGKEISGFEPIGVHSSFVETTLSGEGDVMYDDGLIIKVAEIPADAEEIRVYASV